MDLWKLQIPPANFSALIAILVIASGVRFVGGKWNRFVAIALFRGSRWVVAESVR